MVSWIRFIWRLTKFPLSLLERTSDALASSIACKSWPVSQSRIGFVAIHSSSSNNCESSLDSSPSCKASRSPFSPILSRRLEICSQREYHSGGTRRKPCSSTSQSSSASSQSSPQSNSGPGASTASGEFGVVLPSSRSCSSSPQEGTVHPAGNSESIAREQSKTRELAHGESNYQEEENPLQIALQ